MQNPTPWTRQGHHQYPSRDHEPKRYAGGPVNHQDFFTKVFGWMFLGLGITAAVAVGVVMSGLYRYVSQGMVLGLFIGKLALVWWLSSRLSNLSRPMSYGAAIGAFLFYAALNGVTFSLIFLMYDIGSIFVTFGATALMFGAMFALGFFIKKDISGMGRFLIMALIGFILATIFNSMAMSFGWFSQSGNMTLYWALTYFGILIFAGLTAWDAQKLKQWSMQTQRREDLQNRLSVLGALSLYLDFINLFLLLLRFLGGGRD